MEYFCSYVADYNNGVTDDQKKTNIAGNVRDAEATETGDENNIGLWIAIAVIAALVAGSTVFIGIKRRQER